VAIVEVSIVPIGTESTSLSSYVANCLSVLKDSFAVIRKMHEVPFMEGAQRVVTSIKLDDRRDKESTSRKKVASVLDKK